MFNKKTTEIKFLEKLEKDILTPITFIQGYVGILKNDKDLSKNSVNKVSRIEKSAERILLTTQSLLMIYNLNQDNKKIKLESMPLLSNIHESVDKYIRIANNRKINFSLECQNTNKVITNKKYFNYIISILSQEILIALEKGSINLIIKKEGSDMLVIFETVFNQDNQINLSHTTGYELAQLFLKKVNNKISHTKKDNVQKISIRLLSAD